MFQLSWFVQPPTTVGLQRETDAPNLMELWKRQDELILFESTEVVSLSTRLATTWSVPQWMAENWLCQFGAMEAWCLDIPEDFSFFSV